jgi:hypothetical protein
MNIQSFQEYPFFQVVFENKTYVFVGSKKELYMRSKHKAVEKTIYVQDTIFNDDTVDVVTSKIKAALKIDQVYLWVKTTVNVKLATRVFLDNVFAGRKIISFKEISYAYKCVTNHNLKDIPHDSLTFEQALDEITLPETVLRPVGFQRVDGAGRFVYFPIASKEDHQQQSSILDESTMTIESYKPLKQTIYASSDDQIHVSPPSRQTYDTKQLEALRDFTPDPNAIRVKCLPSFIQVRVIGGAEEEDIDLFKIFSKLEPTEKVPFLRWVAFTKTMYKMHKSFLNNYKDRAMKDLTTWTRPFKFVKTSFEHVIAKIPINSHNVATLIIETDGSYNIRINYRKGANPTLKTISQDFKYVYDVFHPLKKLAPMSLKEMWTQNNTSNTRIIRFNCGGTISDMGKTVNLERLLEATSFLNHVLCIHVAPKGFLGMLYTRFSGFTSDDNIIQYLNRQASGNHKTLVDVIEHLFSLKRHVALELFKTWEIMQKKTNPNQFFVRKVIKTINVNMRPHKSLVYEYSIENATSVTQVKRIVHALLYIIDLAKKTTPKKTTKSIKPIIPAFASDDDDDLAFKFDLDEDEDNVGQFFDEDDEDAPNKDPDSDSDQEQDDPAASKSINDIKRSMNCPAPIKQKKSTQSTQPATRPSLLNKLKEADKSLFYDTIAGKKYSDTCQKVSESQPVALLEHEVEYNNKCFPEGIPDTLNVGSTPELERRNFYTCPKVWCPKSRVALTLEQFQNDYNSQCPFPGIIKEEPYVIDKNKWKNRTRYIYSLKPTYHKKNLCMPCCGLKKQKPVEKQVQTYHSQSNSKYIKDHGYPVEQGRYGMLPQRLSEVFQNKYCGDKNGENGIMNVRTDCYTVYGISPVSQPFLQSLVETLENPRIKTVADIVSSIVKHLDMMSFLALGDGIVCRSFLPNINSIQDRARFQSFYGWFLNPKQESYVQRFNLGQVSYMLKRMPTFSLEKASAPAFKNLYKEILREYQFYTSYTTFIAYLSDDKIVKTHEYIAPMLFSSWLNPRLFNYVIIEHTKEEFFISCPIYQSARDMFDKERPTIMLLRQGSIYYEPIHHIRYVTKPVTQIIDRVHGLEGRAAFVINQYLSNCNATYFDKDALAIRTLLDSSAHVVKAQVLDFRFHVIAFLTKTNVIVPLKKPTPMDIQHSSTFVFIDTCLKGYTHTIDEKLAKGVFNAANKIIKGYYVPEYAIKIDGKKAALKLADISIVVPLVPYTQIKKAGFDRPPYEEIVKDGAIFTMYEKSDPRRNMVSMNQYIDIMYLTFRNEIINLILRLPSLRSKIDMLRHMANPLPWAYKRMMFIDAIDPYMTKMVYRAGVLKPEVAQVATGLSKLCSNISPPKIYSSSDVESRCTNQCTATVMMNKTTGKRETPHCRLSVPKDYYNILLERSIDHLLNPINQLELVEIKTDNKLVDENIVVFTGTDVMQLGIETIVANFSNVGTSISKAVLIDGSTLTNESNSSSNEQFLNRIEKQEMPTLLAPSFRAFTLYRILDSSNWLLELFTTVNRRINPKTAHLDANDINALIIKKIRTDYRADADKTFERLNDNPTFKTKVKSNTEKDVMEAITNHTKISEYELEILSKIVNINIMITSNKGIKTPERIRCIGKRIRDYYLMFHQRGPATFELYCKVTTTKYLLTLADFGQQLSKCVRAKCQDGNTHDTENLCPPYGKS